MTDKITKDSLYKELTERIEKQLAMIKKLEGMMAAEADVETLTDITKAYNNIVTLYNATCENLIKLKRWNYADEDEKKKELDNFRDMMKDAPMPTVPDTDEEDAEGNQ